MSETVRVALDVMGGDRAPGETVLGAIEAAREYGIGVYLVGQAAVIRAELAKHDTNGLDLPIETPTKSFPWTSTTLLERCATKILRWFAPSSLSKMASPSARSPLA